MRRRISEVSVLSTLSSVLFWRIPLPLSKMLTSGNRIIAYMWSHHRSVSPRVFVVTGIALNTLLDDVIRTGSFTYLLKYPRLHNRIQCSVVTSYHLDLQRE